MMMLYLVIGALLLVGTLIICITIIKSFQLQALHAGVGMSTAGTILPIHDGIYRTIFESASDIFMLIDGSGTVLQVNRQFHSLLGYRDEEIVGKNILNLPGMLSEEGQVAAREMYVKRREGHKFSPYEVEILKLDGDGMVFEINSVTLPGKPGHEMDMAILRNVTERKRAQEALEVHRDLIDHMLMTMPAAVLVTDGNMCNLLSNPSYHDYFGDQSLDDEAEDTEAISPLSTIRQAIAIVSGEENAGIQLELELEKEGGKRTLVAHVLSMAGCRVLVFVNDVTDERSQQQKLHLADRMSSVGEMAAGVAHEVNNPLANIMLLSRLLTEEDVDEKLKADLELINKEARRASVVIKDLLTFARKHEHIFAQAQVNCIIEEVLKLRTYEHKRNNITVERRLSDTLPEVMLDYFQVQQVFLNVVINAEQAMAEAHRGGRLTVISEEAGDAVRVSFIDDGPGIEQPNLDRIFDPFFTTKDVGKGTGLGLSICYGIIRSHNGKIYATSEYSKGAAFIIELPLKSRQMEYAAAGKEQSHNIIQ